MSYRKSPIAWTLAGLVLAGAIVAAPMLLGCGAAQARGRSMMLEQVRANHPDCPNPTVEREIEGQYMYWVDVCGETVKVTCGGEHVMQCSEEPAVSPGAEIDTSRITLGEGTGHAKRGSLGQEEGRPEGAA